MINLRFDNNKLSVWEGVILCIRMDKEGKIDFLKKEGGFVRMAVMHPGFPILVQYQFTDNYDYIGSVVQIQQHEVPQPILDFMNERFVSSDDSKTPAEHMYVWALMDKEGEESEESSGQDFWVSVREASVKP